MSDLVEFLRARLDEDEQIAREAAKQTVDWDEPMVILAGDEVISLAINPSRVLADIEGKRRIIADLLAEPHFLNDGEWYGCRAVAEGPGEDDVPTGRECTCGRDARLDQYLRLFALPYADHANYREEWRP